MTETITEPSIDELESMFNEPDDVLHLCTEQEMARAQRTGTKVRALCGELVDADTYTERPDEWELCSPCKAEHIRLIRGKT